MKHLSQKLLIEQLNKQIEQLAILKEFDLPETGWINFIRKSLKMPLKQLAERLQIASPSAKQMELREIEGAITIKTMTEVAGALNLKFVYGFIPIEESIQQMIDRRALEIARYITTNKMSKILSPKIVVKPEKIEMLINEVAEELKRTMPRYFWSDEKDEWKKGSVNLIDLQTILEENKA
jgi:predicted DNA-binding mobile mystery protein A